MTLMDDCEKPSGKMNTPYKGGKIEAKSAPTAKSDAYLSNHKVGTLGDFDGVLAVGLQDVT
jgi:hypothetical protein